MRRLLSSAAIAALLTGSAVAADLPATYAAPAPAPVYVAPIFTWTGFYVGLNAGATFNDNDHDNPVASDALYTTYPTYVDAYYASLNGYNRDDDDAKFTGGVQLGYNWQFGSLVVGIEGDINFRDRGDDRHVVVENFNGYTGYDVHHERGRSGSWFATLRPRIGMAFNRTLLYVTGGLAYADSDNDEALYVTNNGASMSGYSWRSNNDSDNWGWTLGAGVEHAFSNNWTAKLEYLYVNIDRDDTVLVNASNPDYTFRSSNEETFHVVRVGLNYKFGGFGGVASSAPVLARY